MRCDAAITGNKRKKNCRPLPLRSYLTEKNQISNFDDLIKKKKKQKANMDVRLVVVVEVAVN